MHMTQTQGGTTLQIDLDHATHTLSHPRTPNPHFHMCLAITVGSRAAEQQQQQMGHEDKLAVQTCQTGISHTFSLQQIQVQSSPILCLLYIQVPSYTNENWGSLYRFPSAC